MATLKEFEEALRQNGMTTALAVLDGLRQRDRATRQAAPARRVTGTRMTPELARRILELHGSTAMTQQEIAFQLGVNQGRVNEVIKRGKWLDGNPASPEARARDKAMLRTKTAAQRDVLKRRTGAASVKPVPAKAAITPVPAKPVQAMPAAKPREIAPKPGNGQLSFGGL